MHRAWREVVITMSQRRIYWRRKPALEDEMQL